MKILFVVHRAYPYPGGSEAFVHWMAVECLRRGHQVGIFADKNQGDHSGIFISSNATITSLDWDLIIVHGADCISQDFIHTQGPLNPKIPILYQIIQPSSSSAALQGLARATYLGVSTVADRNHVFKHRWQAKMREIPHGIPEDRLGKPGFRKKYNIAGRMSMSAGGFWTHKGMQELANKFRDSNPPGEILCLFGYAKPELAPEQSDKIKIFHGLGDPDLLDALSESDVYIMNSRIEGFGLVLLEAMLNQVLWVSRPVGGAPDMQDYGFILPEKDWCDEEETKRLVDYINLNREDKIKRNLEYIKQHHLISNTVDGIEKVLEEL